MQGGVGEVGVGGGVGLWGRVDGGVVGGDRAGTGCVRILFTSGHI